MVVNNQMGILTLTDPKVNLLPCDRESLGYGESCAPLLAATAVGVLKTKTKDASEVTMSSVNWPCIY